MKAKKPKNEPAKKDPERKKLLPNYCPGCGVFKKQIDGIKVDTRCLSWCPCYGWFPKVEEKKQ